MFALARSAGRLSLPSVLRLLASPLQARLFLLAVASFASLGHVMNWQTGRAPRDRTRDGELRGSVVSDLFVPSAAKLWAKCSNISRLAAA
jgi:hypothetical protein